MGLNRGAVSVFMVLWGLSGIADKAGDSLDGFLRFGVALFDAAGFVGVAGFAGGLFVGVDDVVEAVHGMGMGMGMGFTGSLGGGR